MQYMLARDDSVSCKKTKLRNLNWRSQNLRVLTGIEKGIFLVWFYLYRIRKAGYASCLQKETDTCNIAGRNRSVFISYVEELFHNARNKENPTNEVHTYNFFLQETIQLTFGASIVRFCPTNYCLQVTSITYTWQVSDPSCRNKSIGHVK